MVQAQMQVAGRVPQMNRVMRHPQHTFNLRGRPWAIQPFLLAPVLPGETMKNLLLQSRVITDPITNSIIGWWCEYFFFYVKHRDLYDRDLFTQMMLNPEADLSSLNLAAKPEYYHVAPSLSWTALCLERVVEEYFRGEGETLATGGTLGGLPVAQIDVKNYLDSAINDAAMVTPSDEILTDAGSQFGAAVHISEVEASMRRYQAMRDMQLTDMTYEDFLATYGVRPEKAELHKPELIRFIREWSYPTNTIDPTSGTARSAVSWAVAERADKDRFFREPGFIFGVSVVRPKVYLKNARGSAADAMLDYYTWLPAVLNNDPATSLKKIAATSAPLMTNTDAYWLDLRDLLLYGDQFLNYDHFTSSQTVIDANIVGLPTAALGKRYAALSDADSLFVSAAPANQIRQDGIVSLSIAGRQTDTSPMSMGTNITV